MELTFSNSVYEPVLESSDRTSHTYATPSGRSHNSKVVVGLTLTVVLVLLVIIFVVAVLFVFVLPAYEGYENSESTIGVLLKKVNGYETKLSYLNATVRKLNHLLSPHIKDEAHMPHVDVRNQSCNPYLDGVCYRVVMAHHNWTAAKHYCNIRNEHLATFDSLESASWFTDLIASTPEWQTALYIGGHRQANGKWYWDGRLTGEMTLSWWGDNEPTVDGPCLEIYGPKHKFNDVSCGTGRAFVCETEF